MIYLTFGPKENINYTDNINKEIIIMNIIEEIQREIMILIEKGFDAIEAETKILDMYSIDEIIRYNYFKQMNFKEFN